MTEISAKSNMFSFHFTLHFIIKMVKNIEKLKRAHSDGVFSFFLCRFAIFCGLNWNVLVFQYSSPFSVKEKILLLAEISAMDQLCRAKSQNISPKLNKLRQFCLLFHFWEKQIVLIKSGFYFSKIRKAIFIPFQDFSSWKYFR